MSLLATLPKVRGKYREQADLSASTWFRVGGPAEVLFKPADEEDLAAFLKSCPREVPVTVLGVGSNLLVRDGGLKGVVIRLGREFAKIERTQEGLEAGAGALDVHVAMVAAESGIAGLEFLVGIPGTLGGALAMNAGAYGSELKDVLKKAWAVDRAGALHELSAQDMGFTYRGNAVPKDWIFTRALLEAAPGEVAEITQRMQGIIEAREASQPVRSRTGGSTFKNPPGHKAWELIDKAGCRGLTIGGAQVSEKHTNFLINTGTATAADLEKLGEEVRARVKASSGVELQWEIKRLGEGA